MAPCLVQPDDAFKGPLILDARDTKTDGTNRLYLILQRFNLSSSIIVASCDSCPLTQGRLALSRTSSVASAFVEHKRNCAQSEQSQQHKSRKQIKEQAPSVWLPLSPLSLCELFNLSQRSDLECHRASLHPASPRVSHGEFRSAPVCARKQWPRLCRDPIKLHTYTSCNMRVPKLESVTPRRCADTCLGQESLSKFEIKPCIASLHVRGLTLTVLAHDNKPGSLLRQVV